MKNDELNPIKELTFGAISGTIGKIIEFPFDTIKVRLQSSVTPISTWSMIRSTYHEGIIKGFYQGLKAPLIGASLENAILFTTYNSCLEVFRKQTFPQKTTDDIDLKLKAVSGGIAGFMVSFILTPVELVKCQLQVKNLSHKLSPAKPSAQPTNHLYTSIIKDILRRDGIKGLWKGLESTLVRETTGTMIWFSTYEVITQYLNTKSSSQFNSLVSGAIAGLTFNLIIFPIDTIKSNIQTNDILKHGSHNSLQVIKNLGIKNLYNGLTITLIRSLPANAMIFYSYEVMKRNF